PLDEQFGIGCFEDDDYCLRAIAAGYRAVIAADAFVHHYGSRTFLGSGVDAGALMRENSRRFQEKWSGNGAGAAAPLVRPELLPDNPAHATSSPGATSKTLYSRESVAEGRVRAADDAMHPAVKSPRPFAVEIAPEGGLRLRLDVARPKLSL